MKIYAVSGLGADERVFQYLTLDCEIISLNWKRPKPNEPLDDYAKRLAEEVETNEPFGILGLSFGGLVAVEMSKILSPNFTILISSVETKNDLRPIYHLLGKTGVAKIAPVLFFNPPKRLSSWFFGAENKKLLHQILADTDPNFAKWAVNQLLTWKNEEHLKTPIFKLSGNRDKLMPVRNAKHKTIDGGAHFMIVDRAEEVSTVLNQFLKAFI